MRTEAGQAVVDVSSYHAQVQRGERFWLIYVPELDRWSQARSLAEVDETVRDLIAVMTDVSGDSIELTVSLTLPESVSTHLASAERLREQASRANSDAAGEVRAAARELRATGMTVRDLGRALGVSYQRAHQLVHT